MGKLAAWGEKLWLLLQLAVALTKPEWQKVMARWLVKATKVASGCK